MSDYEDGDWNNVGLAERSPEVQRRPPPKPIIIEQIAPNIKIVPIPPGHVPPSARRQNGPLKPHAVNHFEPLLQTIQPRAHHGTHNQPPEQVVQDQQVDEIHAAYQSFLDRPDKPDDVHCLDVVWGKLLHSIPTTPEHSAKDVARNNFETIRIYSEAFIKTPGMNSTTIEIWGDLEQCDKAKTRLQAWEKQLRADRAKTSRHQWTREQAYDGRKEDRKRQKEWEALEDQAIQGMDDAFFDFEAYLIWPPEHDLDAYLSKYDAGILQQIAKEFQCRFKHERKARPRCTVVQALTEEDLLSAYQRLINLVKEMTSPRYRGTHGSFCRLPSPSAYRTQVYLEETATIKSKAYLPVLFGHGLEDERIGDWLRMMRLYDKQNRTEMRISIDACLKTLYLSQTHVRLRVVFGDLFINGFSGGTNGTKKFDLDEYLNLLQNRRTRVSEPALRGSYEELPLLAERLASVEELHNPLHIYKQAFEFKGTDATNRLRLEIEMQPGHDLDEPQVCSQRWLTFKTFNQHENILGMKVLDFEKPGYMVRADAWELFMNENITGDMDAFRSAIRFKPSREGFAGHPKLKSTFPNHGKLISVTETTAVKFQFKDTDGIVEFQREELYKHEEGRTSKTPNETKFLLSYYYPEWDNLLSDFSNINPGEAVDWERDVLTFFPDYEDPDHPRALPKGFKAFMRELSEIQDLLKDVLSTPAAVAPAAETDLMQHI